jgi:hypothetical protein
MPGRARFKRAGFVVFLIGMAIIVAACASADHSWQGEFDARLEGAARTIEGALEEAKPGMSPGEYMTTFGPAGNSLFFKSQLVKELDPPPGCEAVQVKGKAAVYGAAERIGGAFKNLTPRLERNFSATLEEQLALLEKREREAATCA